MKVLRDLLTENDGESYCIARVLWTFGVLAFVVLECFKVVTGTPFDMQNFGIGFGAVMVSGGGAVWAKGKEPR